MAEHKAKANFPSPWIFWLNPPKKVKLNGEEEPH